MGNYLEQERAAARMQSYTGKAVLTFFLYWFLWLPGLIVNWIFYQEAKRMERIAHESLPGTGCLTIMLWLNLLVLVISVCGGMILLVIGMGSY